jgi:hypothetical protein
MENWKAVAGFAAYKVSDLGRVKRVAEGHGATVGKILKTYTDSNGYARVSLCENSKRVIKPLHRLVAIAFLPNPDNLPEVNHKGPTTDNRASELEWISEEDHRIDQMVRKQHGEGVHFDASRNKWTAVYSPVIYTYVNLGRFNTKREALAARKAAVETLGKKTR